MDVESASRRRIADLSRPGPISIEFDVSEAAELLMSMCVLSGEESFDTYDLGKRRLDSIRAGVSPDLLETVDNLLLGSEKVPAHLLGIVYETPRPRTVPAFLAQLERTEPLEVQLNLLAYYMHQHHVTEPERILAAALGDTAARAEVLASVAEWVPKQRAVQRLLELGPDAVKETLLEVLPRWRDEVFAPLADEAMPLVERDARAKEALARTQAPDEVVELTTSGFQYTPAPEIRRYVFFPSYWDRPWVTLIDYKHVKIFCYPVTVDRDEAPVPAPEQVARIYKALGDEGRLRLLKRLRTSPLTLGEAADELGLGKSTAHHHLAILRHAGFVRIRDDGENVYSLRDDLLPQAGALLTSFLDS